MVCFAAGDMDFSQKRPDPFFMNGVVGKNVNVNNIAIAALAEMMIPLNIKRTDISVNV
jgi:hypothetical protein